MLPHRAVRPGFNMDGEGTESGLQRKLAAVTAASELGTPSLPIAILLSSGAVDRLPKPISGLRVRKRLPATKESPLSGQSNAGDRIYEAFQQAKDLPEVQRDAMLADLTLTAREVAEVRFLLANLPPAGSNPSPVSDLVGNLQADFAAATAAAPLREGPGMRIGQYKLLQAIGEGGFGSVFMAEQERPVRRRVALKIIKLGMDTHQVVARFEQERQALAMMDHPNIAKVLDAGATESGRPFFVMELVKGEPIVAYCDKNNLSIEDRLELFEQVCQAVQHAHTKGIIHRDIKPSNILVSSQDGKPQIKVIDFGIAKATASKLTEMTLFTEHRQMIGTPEYMSPEQAEGSLDIDTRTDVYSLGVLLYELLTGTTPFSSKDLRAATYAEIQRMIREVDPPKPSTRISSNSATIGSVATNRRTAPRRLGTLVRGELDWIVMKALEKDRQRRYETANGLGMDIRRYLSGEAVNAAPPSRAYRVKKFIRRNKGSVAAGSAVTAVLVLGLIGTSVGLFRAERARAGEAAQRVLADAAKAEAVAQAAIAEAVSTFQTDMLAAVDPDNLPTDPVTKEPLRDRITVLQVMQAAVQELDGGALKDQPLMEASVRSTIGRTLRGLGRLDEAEPNLRKSLALRRGALPAGHRDTAGSLNNYATILREQNKLAEAEPLIREALKIQRTSLPAGHLDIANSLNNLARLLQDQNRLAEAEPLVHEAMQISRAALPAGDPDIVTSLSTLSMLLIRQNKIAEAEPVFREILAINRTSLPAGHPRIATSLNNLANLLQDQGKPEAAEPFVREAVGIQRSSLPKDHPDIATGLNNLAVILKEQNKLVEAEPLSREALVIYRAALPGGHPEIANGLNNLAVMLKEQNKLVEAEPLFREALEILRAAFPAGHEGIAITISNLADLQQKRGQTAPARAGWDEAISLLRDGAPDGSALLARTLWRSGSARLENVDATAALPELEEAVSMAEKYLPADHPHLTEHRETLTECKAALAELAEPGAKDDGG
jgi:serine/threonine protein kinase